MLDLVDSFFETTSFMAHGYCLMWRSDLIALHAISDAVIFLSYFIIPVAIFYFVVRRQDLAHKGILWLFAAFILACGATHLIGLATLWQPIYGVEGVVKAATASVSAFTAVVAWFVIPKALLLPSPAMLRQANIELSEEIGNHRRTNDALMQIRAELEDRVHARTRELEVQAAELEAANRSLSQFAHIASHDLQEPLRKILSYVELLEQALQEKDAEEIDLSLTSIRSSAERARSMVTDLLRFSKMRQHDLSLQTIDLEQAVAENVELYRDKIGARGGSVTVHVASDAIVADPLLVNQVFQNIIGNAIKYVPAERRPQIAIRSQARVDHVRVSVSDNGIGFSPQAKDKIFEPFARAHGRDVAEGSGIGLAIVAQACRIMGWRIDVDPRPGEGATFFLDIPRRPAPAEDEKVLTVPVA